MKLPLLIFPVSESFTSLVCLGNISVSCFNLNRGSRLLKKDLIITALIKVSKNKYKCMPPLLDNTGIKGKLFFCIISTNLFLS